MVHGPDRSVTRDNSGESDLTCWELSVGQIDACKWIWEHELIRTKDRVQNVQLSKLNSIKSKIKRQIPCWPSDLDLPWFLRIDMFNESLFFLRWST